MKAYKGFNKDMTCRGFQFEEGKTYEEDSAKLCEKGFHACLNPVDCIGYYFMDGAVYHEVELDGVSEERHVQDTKVAAKKITIGAQIDIAGMVKGAIDFVFASVKKDGKNEERNDKDSAQMASSGDYAKMASSGYSAQMASSGDYAKMASSGYSAKMASSGYSAQMASSGDSAKMELNGQHAVGAAIGYGSKIRGKVGNWIILAEYDKDGVPVCVKSAQIDGKSIKTDTWYTLKNGKFVEVQS